MRRICIHARRSGVVVVQMCCCAGYLSRSFRNSARHFIRGRLAMFPPMAAPACIMGPSLPRGSPDATPRMTPRILHTKVLGARTCTCNSIHGMKSKFDVRLFFTVIMKTAVNVLSLCGSILYYIMSVESRITYLWNAHSV